MLSNFRRYSHQSVWMNNWEVNLVRPYAVRRPRVCIFYFFLSFFLSAASQCKCLPAKLDIFSQIYVVDVQRENSWTQGRKIH